MFGRKRPAPPVEVVETKPVLASIDPRMLADLEGKLAALDKVQADLITEMDAAVEFAINSPYPDPSKVDQDIYA